MTGPPPPPFFTPLSSVGGSGVNINPDNTNNPNNLENDSPNLQELILGQMASLTELIKKHNALGENVLRPIRLDFRDERNEVVRREKAVEANEDLSKPFKEASRSPFTSRIVEFSGEKYTMPLNMKFYDGSTDPNDHLTRFTGAANQGQWPMPTWCLMFQQTLDGAAGGWFERLEPGSINSWNELREQFSTRFSLRRKCTKDPTEITKIVRRAHESLADFKERWTDEASYIIGVPEIMRISAFMNAHKCPALAKKFSDRVPRSVTEMFTRVDDFIRAEDAYRSTELPRGEGFEANRRRGFKEDKYRSERKNEPRHKDAYNPYVAPRRDLNRNDHYRSDRRPIATFRE